MVYEVCVCVCLLFSIVLNLIIDHLSDMLIKSVTKNPLFNHK